MTQVLSNHEQTQIKLLAAGSFPGQIANYVWKAAHTKNEGGKTWNEEKPCETLN